MPRLNEQHADGTIYPTPNRNIEPWIGVDLDGTLAHYDKWEGPHKIGKPIKKMVAKVNSWHKQGKTVKIITARVGNQPKRYVDYVTGKIHEWLELNGMPRLGVTATKDLGMVAMYDDRCIQIVPNTGLTLKEYLLKEAKKEVQKQVRAAKKDKVDHNTVIDVGGVNIRAYQFASLSPINFSDKGVMHEPASATYFDKDGFIKYIEVKTVGEWARIEQGMKASRDVCDGRKPSI